MDENKDLQANTQEEIDQPASKLITVDLEKEMKKSFHRCYSTCIFKTTS